MELDEAALLRLVHRFFRRVPDSGIRTALHARRKTVVVDAYYLPVAKATVDRVMRSNPLLIPAGSETEVSDCDDYALQVKATITSLRRQENLLEGRNEPPPAVGIVITGTHALTAFVGTQDGEPYLALADASRSERPIVTEPAAAVPILGEPPVRLLYF